MNDGWIHLGLLTISKGVLLTPKTGCSNGLSSKARDHRDPCSAEKGRRTHHGGGLQHNHASQQSKNGLTDRPEFRSWWEEIVIQQEQGFLGQFPQILQPGDIQSLVFLPAALGVGPFWMSDAKKEDSRHDKHLGTTTQVKLRYRNSFCNFKRTVLRICSQGKHTAAEEPVHHHGLLTHKLVAIVHKQTWSELEISLKGRGNSTKGKNKRELVRFVKN